jgi:hypothetical protein
LHTADARIARSKDGGESWEILHKGLPEHIRGNIEALSMDVWNRGAALFAGTTDGEVFYSTDEGAGRRSFRGLAPYQRLIIIKTCKHRLPDIRIFAPAIA